MESTENKEFYTIDVLHILKTLLKRAWLIALIGLLSGAVGFAYASYGIAPTYASHIKLYVNNSSFSLGNTSFSISASELSAAQSLVKTYGEILESRSTLERIIEKAEVEYSWKTLRSMVACSSSNGTELMLVTVTCEDPYEASKIANTIAEILPMRITEIIEGASMEVVDSAIPELDKVSPSITKYTAIGLAIGVLLTVIVIVIAALLDDTIHDEEYLLRTYDYPLLGKVPNLLDITASHKYYSHYYGSQD